ncbi:MAG: hypothetical protein V8T09_02890 [Oscillospiraceae bacterium]
MAYVKEHAPSEVYHLAKQENLNSILDDGMIAVSVIRNAGSVPTCKR